MKRKTQEFKSKKSKENNNKHICGIRFTLFQRVLLVGNIMAITFLFKIPLHFHSSFNIHTVHRVSLGSRRSLLSRDSVLLQNFQRPVQLDVHAFFMLQQFQACKSVRTNGTLRLTNPHKQTDKQGTVNKESCMAMGNEISFGH